MAKANRVISKPKPPAVRHVAIVDPNTGVISGYASGTNIVLGTVESGKNWRDITDIPGSSKLNSNRIKRNFFKDGKLKRKPRVRLIVDAKRVEIGRGRAKISYEVLEGEVEELDLVVRSNGNSRNEKLNKHQTLDIGGSSKRRVTVTVNNPLVFVESPKLVVEILPPEELVTPPPVVIVDDVIVEKADKVPGPPGNDNPPGPPGNDNPPGNPGGKKPK